MKLQLIYMSAATRPFSSRELTSLLDRSRKKNSLLGITGMLLYSNGSFLQAIEGETEAVEQLYATIARDERHHRCETLIRTFVDRPNFPEWSMGFVSADFEELRHRPGVSDLLMSPLPELNLRAEPTVAHRLLLGFRDGLWRQSLTGASA